MGHFKTFHLFITITFVWQIHHCTTATASGQQEQTTGEVDMEAKILRLLEAKYMDRHEPDKSQTAAKEVLGASQKNRDMKTGDNISKVLAELKRFKRPIYSSSNVGQRYTVGMESLAVGGSIGQDQQPDPQEETSYQREIDQLIKTLESLVGDSEKAEIMSNVQEKYLQEDDKSTTAHINRQVVGGKDGHSFTECSMANGLCQKLAQVNEDTSQNSMSDTLPAQKANELTQVLQEYLDSDSADVEKARVNTMDTIRTNYVNEEQQLEEVAKDLIDQPDVSQLKKRTETSPAQIGLLEQVVEDFYQQEITKELPETRSEAVHNLASDRFRGTPAQEQGLLEQFREWLALERSEVPGSAKERVPPISIKRGRRSDGRTSSSRSTGSSSSRSGTSTARYSDVRASRRTVGTGRYRSSTTRYSGDGATNRLNTANRLQRTTPFYSSRTTKHSSYRVTTPHAYPATRSTSSYRRPNTTPFPGIRVRASTTTIPQKYRKTTPYNAWGGASGRRNSGHTNGGGGYPSNRYPVNNRPPQGAASRGHETITYVVMLSYVISVVIPVLCSCAWFGYRADGPPSKSPIQPNG